MDDLTFTMKMAKCHATPSRPFPRKRDCVVLTSSSTLAIKSDKPISESGSRSIFIDLATRTNDCSPPSASKNSRFHPYFSLQSVFEAKVRKQRSSL